MSSSSTMAERLRSSQQVRDALDFSRHPERPSLAASARFNRPCDLPSGDPRYGVRNKPDPWPMYDVVQEDRRTTPAELFSRTAHEDHVYLSHDHRLERSRLPRRPQELNPVIFDSEHIFGERVDPGMSAAETLKPVVPAPPIQTSSDPMRFLGDEEERYIPSTGMSTRSYVQTAPICIGPEQEACLQKRREQASQITETYYRDCTNRGPIQRQDSKRTALGCTVHRGYTDSFNPDMRFGVRGFKAFDDTTEACMKPIPGARADIPFSDTYRAVHNLPQADQALRNELPAGVNVHPSDDLVHGIKTKQDGESVQRTVHDGPCDDSGCAGATTLTRYEQLRQTRYRHNIPSNMVFGETGKSDHRSSKPTCIGGQADGTDWGVVNHLDIYAPKR
ncbi:hypothetical protein GMRT_12830 [Giardia muris]|uniref:Uncharacterized protein n=1 Tax=Giardia muris TaxID=5742 RepID=A0A4Z1SNA3_GIAMU|nr:hypothetical protein GMRT_12830 [Giardia muris]|eukprot:TNJ27090.1 hypothetical protein GMRT_12830 [Giardia muris]